MSFRQMAKHVGLVSGGAFFGQAALVLSAPLLTRLYTPVDFGIFAIFVSLSALISVVAALRIEYAIPVVRDCQVAMLIRCGAVISLSIAALLAIVLATAWFLAGDLPDPYHVELFVLLLPMLAIVHGGQALATYWHVRAKSFAINGMSKTLLGVSQALGQVAAALVLSGVAGLIAGYCLGLVIQLVYLWSKVPATTRATILGALFDIDRAMVRDHRPYMTMNASSSLLVTATQMLPPVLIASIFGAGIAGQFALGQRVVGMPVRIISNSAGQVFTGLLNADDRKNLRQSFFAMSSAFALAGLLGCAVLWWLAVPTFAFVFGEPWRISGEIVLLLVPMFFCRFVAIPVSQSLNVLNGQKWHLIFGVLGFVQMIVCFAVANGLDWDYGTAILLFGLGNALVHALLWMVCCRLILRAEA